ncbi:MAG TPA: preprotein translocase subunit YajC [Clostridiaceae bacterium]|nr:preprotein translocase subunit YajC [Clostridiaceae bacterium]
MSFAFFNLPLIGTGGGQGGFGVLLFPVLIIAMMYFFMIRPEKKREKEKRAKRDAMEVGDQVMTIGGIIGKIVNITGDEVTISTSVANSLLTFRKDAINEVIKPEMIAAAKAAAESNAKEPEEKKGFFSRFKKD